MFDSLGEAYDLYNLYSWEHGFGKSQMNAEKTKCMQEIVCGYSVSLLNMLFCERIGCAKKEDIGFIS
jgi:hypothetical protein